MNSDIITHHNQSEPVFNKRMGLLFNGEKNNNAELIRAVVENSPSATQCAGIYSAFLNGSGIVDAKSKGLESIDVGDGSGVVIKTANDIISDISKSISIHNGAFLKLNYDANFHFSSLKVLPYENCRIGQLDHRRRSGLICYSKEGFGNRLKNEDIKDYYAYNSNPKVIEQQIIKDGGIEFYRGQILFITMDESKHYPTPLIMPAYLHADIEHRMALYYNAIIRLGFNDPMLIRHRAFENRAQEQKFIEDIKKISGAEKAGSVLMIQDDWSDDNPDGNIRFDTLKSDVKPEKYAHIEQLISNKIRISYKNIPPQLVDFVQGKLGNTSADDLRMAQSIYNVMVSSDKTRLERYLQEIFSKHRETRHIKGWELGQFKFLDDGRVSKSQ